MSGANYWGDRQADGRGTLTTGKHEDDEEETRGGQARQSAWLCDD